MKRGRERQRGREEGRWGKKEKLSKNKRKKYMK